MTSITNSFLQGPSQAMRVAAPQMGQSPLQQRLGAMGGQQGQQPNLLQQFQAGINPYFPNQSTPQPGGQDQPTAPQAAQPFNMVSPAASPAGGGLVRRGQPAPRTGSYNSFLQSALSGGGMGA